MNISAFTDILPEPFDEAFAILTGEIGLRTIDLRSRLGAYSVDSLPDDEVERIARLASDRGVGIGCIATWGVHGLGGGAEQRTESYRTEARERVDHLCRLAKRLECPHVRIYSMYRPEGFDRMPLAEQEALRDENAEVLRSFGDVAVAHGRTLVIENEPPTLTATTAELADLMARTDHPAVRINWDIVNGWRAGEYPWPARYDLIRSHLRHIHIKGAVADSQGAFAGFAVPGHDGFPHEAILLALQADGFAGTITIDPHYDQFAPDQKLPEDEPHPVRRVVSGTRRYIQSIIERST